MEKRATWELATRGRATRAILSAEDMVCSDWNQYRGLVVVAEVKLTVWLLVVGVVWSGLFVYEFVRGKAREEEGATAWKLS
jgi:hypothetical protein